MTPEQLLARMAEQRAHWATLPGGQRVRFHRPPEVELPGLARGVTVEHVIQYACGWDGFSEATLLGPAVGGADPVPFHRELWAAWVRDNTDAIGPVAHALADAVTAHLQAREATAKN